MSTNTKITKKFEILGSSTPLVLTMPAKRLYISDLGLAQVTFSLESDQSSIPAALQRAEALVAALKRAQTWALGGWAEEMRDAVNEVTG